MTHRHSEILFTDAVRAAQERFGSREQGERLRTHGQANDTLTEAEREFIQARDGFYLASVSESGWPYVQFRGGPAGFVRALDGKTLAYPDFRGNRQYISTGNMEHDGRVALLFMDYARPARLKLLGRARIIDAAQAPELARQLQLPDYRARVERVVLIAVEAFDWNCPQHITPRFTAEQIEAIVEPLRARIAELESQLSAVPG
ncbi:MAG TPA: pyridoxamine 5'-phosphate oxidase family protein [Burkholderiales bacterium]|nr:pyridoxamine 5'-phosphate oxidase family protein [Burkholderiales bacterium]